MKANSGDPSTDEGPTPPICYCNHMAAHRHYFVGQGTHKHSSGMIMAAGKVTASSHTELVVPALLPGGTLENMESPSQDLDPHQEL